MQYENTRITQASGMGGALSPPQHPEHTHHLATDINRRAENRGGMSLRYALTVDYVSPQIKQQIQTLLDKWDASKATDFSKEPLISWIEQLDRHFQGLPKKRLEFIQRYYPDYQ